MPDAGWQLIESNDGPFKTALDHTKYASRYPDLDPAEERSRAAGHLMALEALLDDRWLFGSTPRLADLAVLPFVRQFANSDRAWFDAQDWPRLRAWLDGFTASVEFHAIMGKYPVWSSRDAPIRFGPD